MKVVLFCGGYGMRMRNGSDDEIPKPMQRKYQLLFERRDGRAVVQAKQGACLGCNMHLPPQLFNSLLQVPDIQACPHCNRLLYVPDED